MNRKTAYDTLKAWALCALVAAVLSSAAEASWYWPFGSDKDDSGKQRLSELMEDATAAIDNAADFAAEGKTNEAIAEYRKALAELDKVEMNNPERAATSEFASVRNKRAYVNAAIDSLLMAQARENAKAVAVTDTSELENRVAAMTAERQGKGKTNDAAAEKAPPKIESQMESFLEKERARKADINRKAARAKVEGRIAEIQKLDPSSRKARIMKAGLLMGDGDKEGAKAILREVLLESPNDISALNMLAVCLAGEGAYAEADEALSRAMEANPRDYHAYYNMANLMLQAIGDKEIARRHYEVGRSVGGPEDKEMEESFK
jgi:tetratricopeptide (TPR) repeat protein